MAKFLFPVWPIVGHFYPQVAIAQALRDIGHECAFFTGSKMSRFLQSENFTHFTFRKLDQEKLLNSLFPANREPMDLSKPGRLSGKLRELMVDTLLDQVEDLEPVLDEWKPDVISSDPTFWSPMLIFHEKRGIPVAISSFCPACMVPGPDAPPFGWGLPRPINWKTKLLSRAAYLGLEFMAREYRQKINEARTRNGLAPLKQPILQYSGTMPLYLVPSTPEFDFDRRDLPASVHYVGPLVRKKGADDDPPSWLAGLPRDRAWVYVTEGTVHVSDPLVLRSACQGLKELPVEIILVTGDDRNPDQLNIGPVTPNIHAARWIRYEDVLPQTKIMVTSGGPGSVMAALAEGIPIVIIPTEWDKPDIAQRVVASGAGILITPDQCSPTTVRAAVDRLLTEESFRRNALKMAEILKQYSGAPLAAELLAKLVRAKSTPEPGKYLQDLRC